MYRLQFSVLILFRIQVLLGDWAIYPTTQCHAEEDVNLQEHLYDNLKFACIFGWFRRKLVGAQSR